MWNLTRSKFIWIEAHLLRNGVHRPPKTAKFGGLRYSENFKKWAKINILRFTQYWYQTEGFDLKKQDLRWETTKNLRNGGFDPLKELFSSILAWIMLNRQWTAAKLANGVRIEWNLVHRRKNTCWVQKLHNRALDAIFQDGRRRHLENRLPALERTFTARIWWKLIHRRKITCWVQWTQMRAPDAIFQDGRPAILKIDYQL